MSVLCVVPFFSSAFGAGAACLPLLASDSETSLGCLYYFDGACWTDDRMATALSVNCNSSNRFSLSQLSSNGLVYNVFDKCGTEIIDENGCLTAAGASLCSRLDVGATVYDACGSDITAGFVNVSGFRINYYVEGHLIHGLEPTVYSPSDLPVSLPDSADFERVTGCSLGDGWHIDSANGSIITLIPKEQEARGEVNLYATADCPNTLIILDPTNVSSDGPSEIFYVDTINKFFRGHYDGFRPNITSVALPTYNTIDKEFLGYYVDPSDLHTQCIDQYGHITQFGFDYALHEAGEPITWTAAYDKRNKGFPIIYDCSPGTGGYSINVDTESAQLMDGGLFCERPGYQFWYWNCNCLDPNECDQYLVYGVGATLYKNASGYVCTAEYRRPPCGSDVPVINVIESILGHSIRLDEGANLNYGWNPYLFSYGSVSIEGRCASNVPNPDVPGTTGVPQGSGDACWCRMTGIEAQSEETNFIGNWVFADVVDIGCTPSRCGGDVCGKFISQGNSTLFRQSLYETCGYDITYTCGNGTGSAPTDNNLHYEGQTVELEQGAPGCSLSGSSFVEWACHVPRSAGKLNNDFSLTVPASSVVCDAQWRYTQPQRTYTVTYNCDGNGTTPSSHNNVSSGTDVTLASGCSQPSGQTFNGWYCVAGLAGNLYGGGDTYTVYADTTCTAVWTPMYPCVEPGIGTTEILGQSSVPSGMVWDSQGLQFSSTVYGDTDGREYSYGTVYTYGFCSDTAATVPGTTGSPVSTYGNYCWCQARGFTPSGSSDITPLTDYPWVYSGATCAPAAHGGNSVCRETCAWANGLTSAGISYFHHSLFTKNTCDYNVTYDCGTNGTGSPASQLAGLSNNYQVNAHNANVCTADSGYEFWYWNCVHENNDGSSTAVSVVPGGLVHAAYYDVVCTAMWRAPCSSGLGRINILEDLGGPAITDDGTIDGGGTSVSFGSNGTVQFEGICAANAATPRYSPGTPVGSGQNCWCRIASFTDANGSPTPLSGSSPWVYVETSAGCDANSCAMHCARAVGGNQPNGGSFINQSLYEICPYNLMYDCNNGVSGESSITDQNGPYPSGLSVDLWNRYPYNPPASMVDSVQGCTHRQSYSFTTWDCYDGNGNYVPFTEYDPMDPYGGSYITMPSSDVTCTAGWQFYPISSYNINYVPNGGSFANGTSHPATVQYNETFQVSNPTRSGYTFNRWNITGMDGTTHYYGDTNQTANNTNNTALAALPSIQYFKNLTSIDNATVTFTAVWTANTTYSVNYTCGQINGTVVSGTISPATNQDQYYAGYTNVPLTANPTTSGCTGTSNYNFIGWDCHSTLAESSAINNSYVIPTMPAAAVTCGAVWSPKHTLSYDCSACGTSNPASVTLPVPGNTLTLANSCFLGNAASADIDFLGWHCMLPAGIQPYIGSSYQGGDTYSVTSVNNYDTVCYGICRNNYPCGNGETIYEVLGISVDNPNDNDGDWKDDNIDTGGTLTDLWGTGTGGNGISGNFTEFGSFPPAPYTIEWRTMCTDNSGVPAMSGNPGSSGGQYCWCGVTNEVFYPDGSTNTLDEYPWVFAGEFEDEGDCNNKCLTACNWWIMPEWVDVTGMSWFLHSLYTKTTCEYKITYHGGNCAATNTTVTDTVTGGANYTVKNPNCSASGNILNQYYAITKGKCYEFLGWSTSPYNQNQTPASSQVNYGSCVANISSCSNPTTGNCGTISNVSDNVDLYAICDLKPHNVIYHSGNCTNNANTNSYTDSDAVTYGSSYTVLSPFGAPLLFQSPASLGIPQHSFQGWSDASITDGSICKTDAGSLYKILYGGRAPGDGFIYSGGNDEYGNTKQSCGDEHLYAVCCPLNLDWDVNGGSWPVDAQQNDLENQTRCEWGASAGNSGSIGYGYTPLRTPTRTGYTFNGWLVTGHSYP